MLPLAPGLLSTMNCCLSGSESACASWRAYRSVPPPGDDGTINFTGRAGQVSCAWADAACSAKKTTTTVPNPRFMTFPPAAKVYSRFPPFAKSRLDEIGAEHGILIAKEPRCVAGALQA